MPTPKIFQLPLTEPLFAILLTSSLRALSYQLHALVVIDICAELLHTHHRSTKESVLITGLVLLILDQFFSEVFFDFFLKMLLLCFVLL